MKTTQITLETGSRPGMFDITTECERFVAGAGDGLLTVFVPHATAGIVVLELGSGSEEDLLATLERLLPHDDRWRHRHGSRGHGADHVLPLLAPPSVTVPVRDGHLRLGTWQSIAMLDTNADNTRRSVSLTFMGDETVP
jgi:secondary thiamine-phosphate synthase enzyme